VHQAWTISRLGFALYMRCNSFDLDAALPACRCCAWICVGRARPRNMNSARVRRQTAVRA